MAEMLPTHPAQRPGQTSVESRVVTVIEVDSAGKALVRDQFGNHFDVEAKMLPGKTAWPRAGELWLVDRLYGRWRFSGFIDHLGIGEGGDPSAASYIHVQDTPSDTWTINHNLGRRPSVTIVDSADSVVFGNVKYESDDLITVTFSAATAGKAYLN